MPGILHFNGGVGINEAESCIVGATWAPVLTYEDANGDPVNLTGYTAQLDVRQTDGTLLISLSTANGRITLGGSAGTIAPVLTPALTNTLSGAVGNQVYELRLTSGTVVTSLVRGTFRIEREICDT